MEDKAALQEQLQQYEHTIMQLSGETETIGEYVTLYQTQRAALRNKFKEKDEYIQQLLQDKASLEVWFLSEEIVHGCIPTLRLFRQNLEKCSR